jgi:3-oxoacyl-[acyl-carrier protein] reductase
MLDLQKDYPEAALTFSGTAPLSADEVAEVIVSVIGKNEVEITLPTWRGVIAKAASAMPGLVPMLVETLRRVGLKNQAKYEKGGA